MINISAYTTGFTISFGLIAAIGAQNIFVLRQGVRNEYVLVVALFFAFSDAVLISFGVSGFRQLLVYAAWVEPVLRYGGVIFLLCYGVKSLLAAFQSTESLVIDSVVKKSLKRVLLICLALTWLNPHVYLDTVVLIGAVSTRYAGDEFVFAAGAITASFTFFLTLALGASYLRPLFAKPQTWRILEFLTAVIMWWIALRLILG